MVDRQDIERMALQAEKENTLFADKGCLDFLVGEMPIVGREDKAAELVRALVGGRSQRYVPAFIFVYGRTGSGKSTVVRCVCESLGISYRLANLRKAMTVFGCANLVLAELGGEAKGGQGISQVIERIVEAIEALAKDRLFVLVLDEFDSLMADRRGRPSDFVYRLLAAQEKLRKKGHLVCVVAISNNVAAAEELDDRVRSRLGSAPEVFFNAYPKQDVMAILKDRVQRALVGPVDPAVVEYCADLSSQEHGDARRAIDLLRVAAEIAGLQGEKTIGTMHVDMAAEQLQKDRVAAAMSRASYHLRAVCAALVRTTFLTQEDEASPWFSTSALYRQYCNKVIHDEKPLTYRRVSELLAELENMGLAVSQTRAGKQGYGRQYRLAAPPELIGSSCFAEWWKSLAEQKRGHLEMIEMYRRYTSDPDLPELERRGYRVSLEHAKKHWIDFIGL